MLGLSMTRRISMIFPMSNLKSLLHLCPKTAKSTTKTGCSSTTRSRGSKA
ncbi:hypothetical protein BDFB_009506 [Asbolus verrucosus]|uniref:Uncharacterized protein n=1 Tax=Asbolus verrucosus TaxID=1661398 RepID=A0A482VMA6_ASBVE|nr:hypothetical protein BDFB_009506 [Asbolus verrucosus]